MRLGLPDKCECHIVLREHPCCGKAGRNIVVHVLDIRSELGKFEVLAVANVTGMWFTIAANHRPSRRDLKC